MPAVCPDYWQSYGCEWSITYLWRWMNWVARTDVFALALLLVCIFVVVLRVSYRCHLYRSDHGIEADSRRRAKLADLSIQVGSLRSIASVAPYLGLGGTCIGIFSAFGPIAMEKHAALAMISSRVAAALVTTAAGILVAVPATCFYNYLRTRIDLLESEAPNDPPPQIRRYRRRARRLALSKRFSQLPAFSLIAAPGLAVLVAVYTPHFAPRESTGFGIELAPTCRENDANDQTTVLHITAAGKVLLNAEDEEWNGLAGRLSEIYRVREERTLHLMADDGVAFQTVADALDIVENIPAAVGPEATGMEMENLDITVWLLTPRASNTRCPEPVRTSSGKHASR
jgi:biopolymer transport protein ExbD